MSVDLSSLQTNIASISNLIMVTPNSNVGLQPQFAQGSQSKTQVPSLIFDIEEENTLVLTSDITDHWVEDNTAIQDQIALRPETYTVNGYIGELNDVVPPLLQPLKLVADKLLPLAAFTPVITSAALIAYNEALQAYQLAQLAKSSVISAYNSITGNSNSTQTKQQKMANLLVGYWNSRTLFTVQTPWAIFTDMAIQNLRIIQDGDTRMVSDFEITFKKMRFAKTVIKYPSNSAQSRLKAISSTVVDHGVVQTVPAGTLGSQVTAQKLA